MEEKQRTEKKKDWIEGKMKVEKWDKKADEEEDEYIKKARWRAWNGGKTKDWQEKGLD